MPETAVRRRSHAPVTVVVLGLALGLAMSGSSSAAEASHRVPSTSGSAAAATVTPKALIKQIALKNADFTDGRTVALMTHGNRVHGQPTLGDCGFNFTTEKHRVARHQTLVVPTSARRWLDSNETVAYESSHFAAKALRQLRKAIKQCPMHVYLPSVVAGQPASRYDVAKVHASRQLPVADNAVVTLKLRTKGKSKSYWAVLIFQRHGTVLDAMYGESRKKPTKAKVAALRSLAQITGSRLAAS